MRHSDRTWSGSSERVHALTAGLVLLAAAPLVAQPVAPPDSMQPPSGPHAFGVRDLWALERVSDPQPSPDGSAIVYVRKRYDPTANASTSCLWVVPAAGGDSRRLTSPGFDDSNPRWAPDGTRIAFLSDRGGSAQVWLVDPTGGEPEPLTWLPVDVESFAWSPRGDALACVVAVYPDCPTLECTRDRKAALEGPVTARRYDHLLARHWDRWDSGRRQHIVVVPAARGAPVDLLAGRDLDAPPTPGSGPEQYDWAPDGGRMAFQGRLRLSNAAWSTNLDLYVASTDSAEARCVTEQNLAADSHPRWSPDGRFVAYLAMAREGYESDRRRVVVFDTRKHVRQVLTEAWDRSPTELVWSRTGRTVYVGFPDEGRRRIASIDIENGKVRTFDCPGSATSLRVAGGRGGERIVYIGESLTEPPEVWIVGADGASPRRLTETNAAALAGVRMSRPQSLWYAASDGTNIHAWLHPPVDRRDGESYPLILLVHGGPQGSWEDRFGFRWNPQILAGAGYAVVTPDPRGSTGYGQAFTDAIRDDWGGRCYEDLMRSVDHVVATTRWVDGERLAAAGGSFGGYMMYWIAGHTERFRCLVSHAGLYDLASFYGTTDEQWFPEWEFNGTPWNRPESYARWSPDHYVDRWRTPILVTEGGKDYRVPESQGLAAFTALQRRGIPSQLLWFAEENHHIVKPQNSILWYDSVLSWLEAWLRSAPQSGAATEAAH